MPAFKLIYLHELIHGTLRTQNPYFAFSIQLHEQFANDDWVQRMAALQKYSKSLNNSVDFPPPPDLREFRPINPYTAGSQLDNWIDAEANDPVLVPY